MNGGTTERKRQLDDWFMSEVLPLEAMLCHFLRTRWRDRNEVPDLLQEIYIRVYEAALREKPRHVRAFVFQIAHNLMIDRLRQRGIVSIESVGDFEDFDVLSNEPTPEQHAAARQELRAVQTALDTLPHRCRQAVILRKIEGCSQRQVAERMGVSEATVEAHLVKGVNLLQQALSGKRASVVSSALRYLESTKSKK